MAPTFNPPNFAFGLNVRLYLRPKKTPTTQMLMQMAKWDQANASNNYNRTKLRNVVKMALDIAQVPCTTKTGAPAVDKWLIDEEPSLDEGEPGGYWGVKLVSPVLYTDGEWQVELRYLLNTLSGHFDVQSSSTTNITVHLFPSTLEEVGCTVIDLQRYLGPETKQDKSPPQKMSSDPRDGRAHKTNNESRRSAPTGNTAVYFRVPSSSDRASLVHWASWVVCLMAAAGEDAARKQQKTSVKSQRGMKTLNDFILQGYAVLSPSVRGGLDIAHLLKNGHKERPQLVV